MAQALKVDKNLDGIKVRSVNDGLVFLEGDTAGLVHKLRAIEIAYDVPGVRQVASDIQTKEKEQ